MKLFSDSFFITIVAGLATMIGCVPLFFKKKDDRILISSLGFAAGVMVCVSIIDLLPTSYSMLAQYYYFIPTILFCALFFTLGIIFSMLIDKYLPTDLEKADTTLKKRLYRVGIISMIAIILHNIPEGIATFMASSTNISLGITLAISIALHNIPEGISISTPIFYATGSRKKAMFYTLISALSEPLGAVLAVTFLPSFMNDYLMSFLLSFIAGIMMHISFYELLPTSYTYNNKSLTIKSFVLGLFIMMIQHILFR